MTLLYHTPLTSEQQLQAGLDTAKPLAMADKVRSAELDPLNHVNNARYFEWLERLRVAYIEQIGLTKSFIDPTGPRIVIRSGEIHYKQEMLMGEDYIVTCACTAFRNTSFTLTQEIWSGGTLRATFDCVLVLRTKDGRAGSPIPDAIKRYFQDVEGAVQQ